MRGNVLTFPEPGGRAIHAGFAGVGREGYVGTTATRGTLWVLINTSLTKI